MMAISACAASSAARAPREGAFHESEAYVGKLFAITRHGIWQRVIEHACGRSDGESARGFALPVIEDRAQRQEALDHRLRHLDEQASVLREHHLLALRIDQLHAEFLLQRPHLPPG